jgi:hypothetical protein
MSERAVWQPPPGVSAHDGSPLPPDLDFFAVPPREIGPVSSAYSSLKQGAPAGTLLLRTSIIGASLLLGFCGGMLTPNKKEGLHVGAIIITTLSGCLGVTIAFLCASNHQCHFVGEDGVAYFEWKSSGPTPPSPSTVLAFRDATVLRTFLLETFQNGVSQGTQFTFTWQREPPLPPFKYQGTVRNLRAIPSTARYQFPLAAERAWTSYKMPIVQEEYRRTGSITFPLQPRGFVRLSRDEIEIDCKQGEKAFSMEKIDSIKVKRGNLVLRRIGTKPGLLSSGKWVFSIPYNELADGQLFLIVANSLLKRASKRS